VQLHTTVDALVRLKPEWDRLVAQSDADHFFAQHAWQHLWWNHFGHDYALRLVTVRDETGRLAGIAPLMASHTDVEVTLSLLGGSEVADYLDLIVSREEAAEVRPLLLAAIREHLRWHTLDLHGLPEGSPTPDAILQQYSSNGVEVVVELEDVSPSVALTGSWHGYLASLGKKDRHELRRKLRRAVDDQEAIWHTVADEADLAVNFDAFITLHRLSSPAKAAFMTPQMESYFWDLARMTLAQGSLRLGVLWADDKPLSAAMGFAYGNRLYLYNSGYDPAYASHSVGIAAVGLLLRESAHQAIDVFDFLQGNEPYKYTLGGRDHPVYRVVSRRVQEECQTNI